MTTYIYRLTTSEGLRRRGMVRAACESTARAKLVAAFGPLDACSLEVYDCESRQVAN